MGRHRRPVRGEHRSAAQTEGKPATPLATGDPILSPPHATARSRDPLAALCEGLRDCCLCLRTPGRRRVDVEGQQIVGADLPCALSENGGQAAAGPGDPGCKPTRRHPSEERPHSTGDWLIRTLSGRDDANDKHDRPPIEEEGRVGQRRPATAQWQ